MEPKISKEDTTTITEKIFQEKNLDFRHYKRTFLERRIVRRLQFNKLTNIADYLKKLDADEHEYQVLLEDFLIQVSEFFRDPELFDFLAANIIPKIFENHADDKSEAIRVWCCGCANGEEVYSLAILFQEYLNKHHDKRKILIYGTDISNQALQTARKNRFSAAQLVNLTPYLLEKYFIPIKGEFQVIPLLKNSIKLGQHDLVLDPPINRIDLLLFRNVCIYWDRTLQEAVYQKLSYALCQGGYFVLGKAESLTSKVRSHFDVIDSRLKVFQKKQPINY